MAKKPRRTFMLTFLALHSLRSSRAAATASVLPSFCSIAPTTKTLLPQPRAASGPTRRFMTTGPEGPSAAAAPPLIDVDCNLVHPDLLSLLTPSDGADGDEEFPPPTENEIHPALKILRHPSTVASNVVAALSPSSTIDEAERTLEILSTASPPPPIPVLTTVGVHPYQAGEAGPPGPDSLGRIRSVLASDRDRPSREGAGGRATTTKMPLVSCVGECGLDYSDGFPSRGVQIPWFEAQLDLAFDFGLPLFLHERLAFEDALSLIDAAAERHADKVLPPVIVHCFTGTREECREYVRRGYHISVSGFINRGGEGPEEVRSALRDGAVPLERLMIETDAPYLGFPSCRETFFRNQGEAFDSLPGKTRKKLLKGMYPNVPSSLPLVLDGVVKALNEGREGRGEGALNRGEVARITTRNAITFFGFDCMEL